MTDWDAGGWSGARRAQEDAWLATTAEQRLAWLEDAITFARKALALRVNAADQRADPVSGTDGGSFVQP
ncbi:MAG: hypothetical protein QOE93_1400 [Actinomycetota bacterium]|nr:hypothetical protein [Actinomycetota bacterium]